MIEPTIDKPPEDGDRQRLADLITRVHMRPSKMPYRIPEASAETDGSFTQADRQVFLGASASCDCDPIPVLGSDIVDGD